MPRVKTVLYYVGLTIAFVGIAQMLTSIIGYIHQERTASYILFSGILMTSLGLLPKFIFGEVPGLTERDAILIVAGTWICAPLAGAIPYIIYGGPFSPMNAYFESVSGFTTTGSTILADIEVLPKWLLFWRSETQWLGGIGIIGLMLAIFPIFGHFSHDLLKKEFTTLTGTVLPRAKDVARMLGFIYVGLTLALALALLILGIHWLEAITIGFTTISTGGFHFKNASIAHYDRVGVEMTITAFTFISGLNFAFMYGLLFPRLVRSGGWSTAKAYLIFIAVFTSITAVSLYGVNYNTWGESLRHGFFQIVTCSTTTGFASADSAQWSSGAQMAIIFVSIVGACAGSTAGGVKMDRLLLFMKQTNSRMKRILHPNAVIIIHQDGRIVSADMAYDAVLFIGIYLAIAGIATVLLSLIGLPLLESFTGTVATLGCVGPAFGSLGAVGNYGSVPIAAKIIFTALMLLGRIELFAFLIIFSRTFWRK